MGAACHISKKYFYKILEMAASSAVMTSFAPLKLVVKKLSKDAVLPVRGSAQAAGYDLSSAIDTVIPARGKALVKIDLAMIIPQGCYGRIAPRSGLAWKKHIDVGAGVIDQDYRGPVGVVLFNHASEELVIQKGDRIAQLVLERIAFADVVEVDDLEETERGSGGFGSTGVKRKLEATEIASEKKTKVDENPVKE